MSTKNSSDTIRHQRGVLPACSTVPQPNAPPRAPLPIKTVGKFRSNHVCGLRKNAKFHSKQRTVLPAARRMQRFLAGSVNV